MVKVVTVDDAWNVQETFDGKPHGWVQWKGTSVCMDVFCICGEQGHIDDEFVYTIQCAKCQRKYFVNGHVQLVEIEDASDFLLIPFGDSA